jgi:hypothetical protein
LFTASEFPLHRICGLRWDVTLIAKQQVALVGPLACHASARLAPYTVMGLERVYSRVRDIIGREAESLDVAEEVERLRWMWRPERVRVVVLAESHVWTSSHETRSRVAQPYGAETGFARFVYCLGYGEPQLVEPAVTPNVGTPHYWKLFHDTVCEPTCNSHMGLLKIGEREFQRRVRNKLDLLNKMQRTALITKPSSMRVGIPTSASCYGLAHPQQSWLLAEVCMMPSGSPCAMTWLASTSSSYTSPTPACLVKISTATGWRASTYVVSTMGHAVLHRLSGKAR